MLFLSFFTSALEIYNEDVRDLSLVEKPKLEVREDPTRVRSVGNFAGFNTINPYSHRLTPLLCLLSSTNKKGIYVDGLRQATVLDIHDATAVLVRIIQKLVWCRAKVDRVSQVMLLALCRSA